MKETDYFKYLGVEIGYTLEDTLQKAIQKCIDLVRDKNPKNAKVIDDLFYMSLIIPYISGIFEGLLNQDKLLDVDKNQAANKFLDRLTKAISWKFSPTTWLPKEWVWGSLGD